MPYVSQTWVDGPTGATPMSADRLNHMEQAISAAASLATSNIGAVGDFTGRFASTGGTGTDNRATIQAALDAASQRNGTAWYSYLNRKAVTVTLPPGHYLITAPASGPSLTVPEGVVFDFSQAMLYFDYPTTTTGSWCGIQLNNSASAVVGQMAPSLNNTAGGTKRLYDGIRSVAADNFQTFITGGPGAEIYGFQGASIRLIGSWITHISGIRFTSDFGVIASQFPTSNVYGLTAAADMPTGANRGVTDVYITDCYFDGTKYGGFAGPITGSDATDVIGGWLEYTHGALQLYMTRCVFEFFNALPVLATGYCISFVDCAWEETGRDWALGAWLDTVRSVYIQNFRWNWSGQSVPGPSGSAVPSGTQLFRCGNVQNLTIDGGYAYNSVNATTNLIGPDPSYPSAWNVGRVETDVNDFAATVVYGGKRIESFSGAWNTGHLMLGGNHLWIDAAGKLRIKSSAPTSDLDGVVVGTQT